MHRRAENQCHCCGIYHFQRPDLICETLASDPASPTQKRAQAQETCAMSQKKTSLPKRSLRQKYTP